MTGFFHCERFPGCKCVGDCRLLPGTEPGPDTEAVKRKVQARYSLPYPNPTNRAQRRANERWKKKHGPIKQAGE